MTDESLAVFYHQRLMRNTLFFIVKA